MALDLVGDLGTGEVDESGLDITLVLMREGKREPEVSGVLTRKRGR